MTAMGSDAQVSALLFYRAGLKECSDCSAKQRLLQVLKIQFLLHSASENCIPFSALTLLVRQQEGHAA